MHISGKAGKLLKAAAASAEASIVVARAAAVEYVWVDNKNMIRRQTPKDAAEWKAAVEELECEGLVRAIGNGLTYSVTGEGFMAANKL
jgi:hypothetical protein